MLKTVGAVLAAVSIFGYFGAAVLKLKKALERKHAMLASSEYIFENIRYTRRELFSIYAALAETDGEQKLSVFGALSKLKTGYDRRQIKAVLENSALEKEEARLFSEFLSVLGKTDVDGQLKHCENYKRIFLEEYEKARREYREKRGLYLKTGAYAALAVFVFLL